MHTIELQCIIHAPNPEKHQIADILVAQLSIMGFTGFWDNEEGLKAYIPEKDFNPGDVRNLSIAEVNKDLLEFSYKKVKEKNWNELWEKRFKPVIIDELCIIRAPFHKPEKNYPYEVVIEPKMSFGTGHHATTYLMIREILKINLENKIVLEMGCGTGVLSILAEKRKAKTVWAIDNSEWAYKNTIENIDVNNSKKVHAIWGDKKNIPNTKFDIILANINKNVLLNDIPVYTSHLKTDAILLISGIYSRDLESIRKKAENCGLTYIKHIEKNNWIAATFKN